MARMNSPSIGFGKHPQLSKCSRSYFKQHIPTPGASQVPRRNSHKDPVTGRKSRSFRQLAASQIQFPRIHSYPRPSAPSAVQLFPASHRVSLRPAALPFASIRGSNLSGIRLRPLRSPVPCVLCGLCGCLFHSSDPEPAEASFRLRLRHVRLPVFSVFSVALCEIIPHTEPQRHRGSFEIAVDGPAMPSFIMARPVTASPPATPTAADHP